MITYGAVLRLKLFSGDCCKCNLQQLRMFFSDFFNLVLVCEDIEPRYGRTRTRDFFSTVRVVYFKICMLSINFLKHFLIKSSR